MHLVIASFFACDGYKELINVREMQNNFFREIFQYLFCHSTEGSFDICTAKCLEDGQCVALQYTTFCRLCSYTFLKNSHAFSQDNLFVSSEIVWINQMFGKYSLLHFM